MSNHPIVAELEKEQMRTDLAEFQVGDTVKVYLRIVEGDKERTQMLQGTVIARKGKGIGETFSIHRIAYGEGMVRTFPLHSPRITKIERVRSGKVRRAKLYYLRGAYGKSARLAERLDTVGQSAEPVAQGG
jgi:large subunit ribosomal protein L19